MRLSNQTVPSRETKTFKQADDINENFKCSDLKYLSAPFWFTCGSCMCTYISIINSLVVGSALLQARFGYDEVSAGFVFTMPYLVAAFMSPFTGMFVDKFGHRMRVIIIGSLFNVLAHVINLSLPDCED